MRRASVDEMAAEPVGRYVAGDTYLHFCAAPTLWGIVLWGRPDEAQAIALGRSLVKQLAPPAVPHASIVDASRIEGVDPAAFAAAGRYLANNRSALGGFLTRVAIVRPPGLSGAIFAGAYEVLPRPYPAKVFADAREAYAWLAEAGSVGWPGADILSTLHLEVTQTPTLLADLRALLDGQLHGLAVAAAAKRLGVSERSLQRKLGEHGTTFQDELSDARVRAAQRLLRDSSLPLTSIALEVGCASLQHFSALFRRRVKESPSAYRARVSPRSSPRSADSSRRSPRRRKPDPRGS